jgi:hypothetical protein
MYSVVRLYRFLNLLSIDIVAGAVAGAAYFAAILNVQVRLYAYVSLALTVWIIYTADHLLDAKKITDVASTERHRLHQRQFASLLVLLIIAVAANSILIFFIRTPVLYGGIVMAGAVSLYLVFHSRLYFLKEVAGAVFYCAGLLLPSLIVTDVPLSVLHYTLFVVFFLTALTNLLLFSWFDREGDMKDRHMSFVTLSGPTNTHHLIKLLLALNIVVCIICCLHFSLSQFSIPLAMNAVHAMILGRSKWFAVNDRYRLTADAVFILPILYVIGSY